MTSADLSWRDGGAVMSPCGRYRYILHRMWGEPDSRAVTFIMLNPSTADGREDDPTIRRCIGFAKRLGFGRLYVVNLFAFRATEPADMFGHLRYSCDAMRLEERTYLLRATADSDTIIAAWGAAGTTLVERGAVKKRSDRIREILSIRERTLHCLGRTKSGAPRHPLYLPVDAPLEVWP